jgi:hypothetical protein
MCQKDHKIIESFLFLNGKTVSTWKTHFLFHKLAESKIVRVGLGLLNYVK